MNSSKTDPKIFVTKIIGGKAFHSVVAKKSGDEALLSGSGYSLISEGENLGRVRGKITIECPACGCSKEDFEESGRFGCPGCYSAFGPFLQGLLKKMHKGLRHRGKIPASFLTREVLKNRIADLNVALEAAISSENYEEAARIRDEAQALKSRRNSLR